MRNPFFAITNAILILVAVPPIGAADLRGGISRIDITPATPVTMAGYASRTNLSQGVHDPLSARAMAFENDGKRILLMSLDNLGFYNETAEPLRKAVLDECQLQPSELLMCAIHTHSAPTLTLDLKNGHPNNIEYTRELQGKLAALAKKALAELKPAQLGFGLGSSPVGVNRREVVRDTNGGPKVVLGRNPNVLTDREVQVLKLTRPDGNQLAGVLFAYATHSTSLGPRNYLLSGDIHGLAAQFVENYFGNIAAPEFAGASGNIDPWVRVLPGFNTTNNWVPEPILLGTLLAEEVVTVVNQIKSPLTNTVVKSAIKTVSLPGQKGETPIVVTVASIGDIAFVGLGGEIFTEIGQAIKKASPFAHTFILTHCNGAAGYLPTTPAFAEGGYEVQSSSFAPGADERLAAAAHQMLVELR
jgi:neutral ceramidase